MDSVYGPPEKGFSDKIEKSKSLDIRKIVERVVASPDYSVDKWGNLFYKRDQRRIYNKKGHFVFKAEGCFVPALEIIWRKTNGEIPKNYYVKKIDSGKPHWVSNLALVRCSEKGNHILSRNRTGYQGNTVLDEDKVCKIRADRAKGMKYRELTKKYGVAKSTLSYVVNNKTWNG